MFVAALTSMSCWTNFASVAVQTPLGWPAHCTLLPPVAAVLHGAVVQGEKAMPEELLLGAELLLDEELLLDDELLLDEELLLEDELLLDEELLLEDELLLDEEL